MTVPTLTISPSGAAQAYARAAAGTEGGGNFGAAFGRALDGVLEAGHKADQQAVTALQGGGNFTEVAMAVSHAELALQSAVAIRDKVVQAYQEIMRMPI